MKPYTLHLKQQLVFSPPLALLMLLPALQPQQHCPQPPAPLPRAPLPPLQPQLLPRISAFLPFLAHFLLLPALNRTLRHRFYARLPISVKKNHDQDISCYNQLLTSSCSVAAAACSPAPPAASAAALSAAAWSSAAFAAKQLRNIQPTKIHNHTCSSLATAHLLLLCYCCSLLSSRISCCCLHANSKVSV
jgi:hypothetical protein